MAQAKSAGKAPNWFAIWTSIIVVVVVIAVGAFVVIANNAKSTATEVTASAPDATTGVVTVGSGPKTVDLYIDFMCPYCNQLETGWGTQLTDAATAGKIMLNYHAVGYLDSLSNGTKYSTRAANAFMCVAGADGKEAVAYLTQLYADQPSENSTGLDDATLESMAKKLGVDIADCQSSLKWGDVIAKQTSSMPADGTPIVLVDGTQVSTADIYADKDYFTKLFG